MQVRYLDSLVNSKIEQMQDLNRLIYQVPGFNSSERVQTGRKNDKMGSLIAKIVDLEKELDEDIDNLVDLKMEVKNKIEAVKNKDYRLLLMLRYLNFKTWEEIAEEMHYSKKWVSQALHSRALISFSKT